MDELESLRVVLAREPSQAVVDEGRHKLMNAMRRPAPRPRRRWSGLGLAVAAGTAVCSVIVATAVVKSGAITETVSPSPANTASPTGAASPTRANLSGKEILLAAAATAEQNPEGTGRYWYHAYEFTWMEPGATEPPTSPTKRTSRDEFWNARDGRLWHAKNGGKPKHLPAKTGFYTLYHYFTFEELQKLPTDPDALRDLTVKYFEEENAKSDDGHRFVSMDSIIAGALVDFLWEVPTPPKVRAAAFRALADLSEVTSAGTIDGGNAVRYPVGEDQVTVVVDPETSLLRSVHRVGKFRQSHYQKIIAAQWTDELRSTPDTSNTSDTSDPEAEPAESGE